MKFLNKLVLACVALFVVTTVSVAMAETAVQNKAKQTGLNTASQNQMLTQQLGTEIMVKSQKLLVISKTFANNASGTITVGYLPKCSVYEIPFVSVPTTLTQSTLSTTIGMAVSGITILPTTSVSGGTFPAAGAASATATLASLSQCTRDVPVTVTVSGTVRSGRLDVIVPYFPYNQTQ